MTREHAVASAAFQSATIHSISIRIAANVFVGRRLIALASRGGIVSHVGVNVRIKLNAVEMLSGTIKNVRVNAI